MIKCIAIDDEPLALRQIETYISRVADLQLVALCHSAAAAASVMGEQSVDLLFVDVNMPDKSGVDFVRELQNPPMIIFTTAYSEYAIDGFRLDAVDYLLKPFAFAEFERAVDKARSLVELRRLRDKKDLSIAEAEPADNAASDSISIRADYKVSLVKYADIIFIESVGEYIRLHLTSGQRMMTLLRLKNMESALPADRFMRVHRSYIVNLSHVTGYARGEVFLDSGDRVPLSVNYRDTFREYIDRKHPSQM
ncbi:MAG: response regulator transcription factor [Alistipes sp.]|nr:response regulator transcription factor [Alistipes sp.]MBO5983635.1 response regulator transcription factor [Rikenellaceae bacterium]